jgi:hypothetical protein
VLGSILTIVGKIVYQHDGEGQYDQMERTIQRLLNASS